MFLNSNDDTFNPIIDELNDDLGVNYFDEEKTKKNDEEEDEAEGLEDNILDEEEEENSFGYDPESDDFDTDSSDT